jgi:O-methyltransferase/methyltransferase family protein
MTADDAQSMALPREQGHRLLHLLYGYRVSQALYVAATLDLAGLLAHGPRSSEDLAAATSTHAPSLYRLLRFLAGVGLFDEVAPHVFGLTPLGTGLRDDVEGNLRANIMMALSPAEWEPWGQLLHTVRTGETAFNYVHGMGRFEYLTEHPNEAQIFDRAMTNNTAQSGKAILASYDFSGIERLVDVGGGHGLLLATILQAYPTMHGILVDRPEVVQGAPAILEAAGVADRCEVRPGDFFEHVPEGGDAYVLRQIIHDWDDRAALRILQNCHDAIPASGKLVVIERRFDADNRNAPLVLQLDMQMLVTLGGGERTDDEYRALFAAAGFGLRGIAPLNDAAGFAVFEGTPDKESVP